MHLPDRLVREDLVRERDVEGVLLFVGVARELERGCLQVDGHVRRFGYFYHNVQAVLALAPLNRRDDRGQGCHNVRSDGLLSRELCAAPLANSCTSVEARFVYLPEFGRVKAAEFENG